MVLGRIVGQVVGFLRAGQPLGAPSTGYLPLLALLPRRVTDEEIGALATRLAGHGVSAVSATDIGVAISKVIDDLPSEVDRQRVTGRLIADGWAVQRER
jgi:hypothetical protein